MVRKKVEGDEAQRRAAARAAHEAGEQPSAEGRTTGASKQRTHMPHRSSLSHEEKVAPIHRGKQHQGTPRPARASQPAGREPAPGISDGSYTEVHERVFRAVADAEQENGGEGAYLQDIARRVSLTESQTRTVLHELTTRHGLITELQGADEPDLGPRYEVKPGL